jgi:hypothetical protein
MGFISKVELKYQLKQMGIKIIEGNYIKKSNLRNVLGDTRRFSTTPQLRDCVSALVVCGNEKCIATLKKIWDLINPNTPFPKNEDWTYEESDEIKKGQNLDWESIVHPSNAVFKDPAVVEPRITKTLKKPRGYFQTKFDAKTVANEVYKDRGGMEHAIEDGKFLLQMWEQGKLAPVITIDNKLYDGWHRCEFAYLLGVDVAVIDLKI